jgi:hypothetical protein
VCWAINKAAKAAPRFEADSASEGVNDRIFNALNAGPSIATPAATPHDPSSERAQDWYLCWFKAPMADDTPNREDSELAVRSPRDDARASASETNRGVVAAAARAAASI